jgi:hypothetical protein
VDVDEARRLLDVGTDAAPAEVRTAFRREVRRVHPDSGGPSGAAAGDAVTTLIAAYRVLRGAPAPPPRPTAPSAPARPPSPAAASTIVVEGDTVIVPHGPNEVWPVLLEVAHGLGEVAYVDRSVPVIETIVEFIDHPVSSLLLSPFGRGQGTTAVHCAVEALGGDRPPPVDAVARLVAARLAAYEA